MFRTKVHRQKSQDLNLLSLDGMVRQISNDNENRGTFDNNLIKLPLSIFFRKEQCGEG